jgi:hypothetical protein
MSRVSKVPERYLATAKKQAIRCVKQGEYMLAYDLFESALLDHPQFAYHPSFEKTHEIVHGLLDGKITDKNILIEHILKDF